MLAARWARSAARCASSGAPTTAGERARVAVVRILLVSQMYPGPDDPDLGVVRRGAGDASCGAAATSSRAPSSTAAAAAGPHARLAATSLRTARRFRPDVVYAHFLVPAGLLAALAARAPLVVTAHGQDVENARRTPASAPRPGYVVRRAAAVVAVSDYLRRELEAKVPEARGKSRGDRLRRRPRALRPGRSRALGGPRRRFLCVGSLTERKNVLRLARAFERRGEGTLDVRRRRAACAGARGAARGRASPGTVAHDASPRGSPPPTSSASRASSSRSASRPSRAWRAGRSVVATRVGGPPEFVPPEAGVLVDPTDERRARPADSSRRPRPPSPEPGGPGGRRGARRQAAGGAGGGASPCEPLEIGEPELDERPDRLLEPGFARQLERRLVALAHLLRRDALLEPVVAGDEEMLDLRTGVLRGHQIAP